jgi:DinB family protein
MSDRPDFDERLRHQLRELIASPHAHATLEQALAGVPPHLRGAKAPGQPHTLWRLLEHLRIAQWDILEFSRRAGHESPKWPEGYWPDGDAPPDDDAWNRSIAAFQADQADFESLVADAGRDLFERFPWGDGQTLLREALLIADHNAYHVGQMVLLRQILGNWPPAK